MSERPSSIQTPEGVSNYFAPGLAQLSNSVAQSQRSIDATRLPDGVTIVDLPDLDPRVMNSELLRTPAGPLARYFSFHTDAWRYSPLDRTDPDRFSAERADQRSRDYLIQLAGPMTAASTGDTLGISISNGNVEQSKDSKSSGFALITQEGELQIVSRNFVVTKFGSVQNWIDTIVKPKKHSLFQAPLMIQNGAINPSVRGWNFWEKNKSFNYRFLVEYQDGSKGVFDFHRATAQKQGFQDVINLMVRAGVKNALYMDIRGSEYGTFLGGDNAPHALGGTTARAIHRADSPGGYLLFPKP